MLSNNIIKDDPKRPRYNDRDKPGSSRGTRDVLVDTTRIGEITRNTRRFP